VTRWFRILCLAFTVTAACVGAARAAGPSLLFDAATGEVLSHDREGEPWYPASLTKLMTAYLVFSKLKSGELKLDQQIPVSVLAHEQPPSKIGVPAGKTVSVDFALQTLLVYSANDMAYVLAEAAAGGDFRTFVAAMNAKAHDLGMTGTHFMNPNGLFDPRHVSTARDIAVLAQAVIRDFPEYSHYFSQPYVKVGKRKLSNRNALIREMPEADGMKTGFVCDSGFNLVASATRQGRRLVAVIFGAQSGKSRTDLAEMLLKDGFARKQAGLPKLADLPNMPLGAVVPADMTASICKTKQPVSLVSAHDLSGWGISFGNYDTAQKADMALRGRLLSPSGAGASGPTGVIELPDKKGYAAMVWDLAQQASLDSCAKYHHENAYCDVMSPDAFAGLAALVPAPDAGKAKPEAQGSDGETRPVEAPN
jgi:D-alanyl-D-alanine carboxypeptidase